MIVRKKYSINETLEIHHVSRNAIYAAIRVGRLKASTIKGKLFIYEDDLNAYRRSKYNRDFSRLNGELIFDPEKKELSVPQAAKLSGVCSAKLYYLIARGRIPSIKKGNAIVLKYDDIQKIFSDGLQMRFA